ncbi:hypothetical protein MLD38_033761 [Melastoma candidum]|uniref:Uncharacterized protein n=1 Tax=Melastoma candidum TaxID=119954 RepID=A0ACB9M9M2_9MYRT|nr:hypothetical protein MLD38_033761 [Melastoma candidum]
MKQNSFSIPSESVVGGKNLMAQIIVAEEIEEVIARKRKPQGSYCIDDLSSRLTELSTGFLDAKADPAVHMRQVHHAFLRGWRHDHWKPETKISVVKLLTNMLVNLPM